MAAPPEARLSSDPPSPVAAVEPLWLYLALAVVAAALPLALIRHLSLWYDELFSVYFAAQGPAYLLGEGWARETSPPFYYLLLWFSTELFGRGEAVLRSLSLIAHIGTLPVIYAIARKLAPSPTSWRAVVLYAFGATTMQYAVMARAYALWTLLLALAMWALVSGIRALEAPGADRRCLKAGIGFAAASVAALYAHNTTIVFAVAADTAFLAAWWWHGGRRWGELAAWFGPQIAALVLAAPQLLVIAAQVDSPSIAWIPKFSALGGLALAIELFGGPAYPLMLLRTVVAAVVLGMFLWGAAAVFRRRSPVVALVILTVAGFALICLISVWRPIFLARAALWLMVPVSIVAAAAFDGVPQRWPRLAAFLAAAGLCAANAGVDFWLSRQEPWREIVTAVADNKQPGDVVVVMNATPITAFLYYAPGAVAWDMRHWYIGKSSESATATGALEDRVAPVPTTNLREMAEMLRRGHSIWLVSRLPAQIALHNAFDAQIQPGTAPAFRLQRGSIVVSHVVPAP